MNRSHLLVCLVLALPTALVAQGEERVQDCFLNEKFDNGIPAGWSIGQPVERQTQSGQGLGEYVPAWRTGNVWTLNNSPYFPVPDVPLGNMFLMANDDVDPCNCDMNNVFVITPVLDLTARTNVVLECRVFHEMNLGAGNAYIEASRDGTNWDTLQTVPAVQSEWQNLIMHLNAYDGEPTLQLRFSWSDGGSWASGFALDDVCLRESYQHDLTLVEVHTHSDTIDPFVLGDQSLRYAQAPLGQVAPLIVSAEVYNSGTELETVLATVQILMNGSVVLDISPQPIVDLAPGERFTATVETGWVPTELGTVEVKVNIQPLTIDNDISDNMGSAFMRITGAGWENGYYTMAADEDQVDGEIISEDPFILAVRMEIPNDGSLFAGISTYLTSNSVVGEQIRAILFDENFAFVDTSTRHTITQEDLEIALGYGSIYLPLSTPTTHNAGDYFVGIQHLSNDTTHLVGVRTSGTRPIGANAKLEGITFEITYLLNTPMIRLHLGDFGVGVAETDLHEQNRLRIYPVPMGQHGTVLVTVEQAGIGILQLLDATGRIVEEQQLGTLATGAQRIDLNTSGIQDGNYLLNLRIGAQYYHQHIAVQRPQ